MKEVQNLSARIDRLLTSAVPSIQYQLFNPVRMPECELLGDVGTQRPTEYMGTLNAQSIQEATSIIRKKLNGKIPV